MPNTVQYVTTGLFITLILVGCGQPANPGQEVSVPELAPAPSLKIETIPSVGVTFDGLRLSDEAKIVEDLRRLNEPIKGEFQKTEDYYASLVEHRVRMIAEGYGDGSMYALSKDIPSFSADYDADAEIFDIQVDLKYLSFSVGCITPSNTEYCDLLSLDPSNDVGTSDLEVSIPTQIALAETRQGNLQTVYFVRFTLSEEQMQSQTRLAGTERSTRYERKTEVRTLNPFFKTVQHRDYRSNRHRFLKTVFNSDVIVGELVAVAIQDKGTQEILWTQEFGA